MPKMKTKKAIVKRMRKTSKGKLMHKGAGRGHILTTKSRARKRRMRKGSALAVMEQKRLVNLI